MASRHFMNPHHGRHMGSEHSSAPAAETERAGKHEGKSGHHPPHIHIHAEKGSGKVHVHIMHHDGPPEHHEHEAGDHEGIKAHIDQHYGQDHGEGEEGGSSLGGLLDEEA